MRSMPSVTSRTLGRDQRRVIVVVEQHALGADRIVRHELRAQCRILHLSAQVRERFPAGKRLDRPHLLHERRQLNLAEIEPLRVVVQLRERGLARQQPLRARRIQAVLARHQPVGRALEDRESCRERRDLRDELHRARRVADHGDALRRQVDRMVPLRRMELRARRRCPWPAIAGVDGRLSWPTPVTTKSASSCRAVGAASSVQVLAESS